MSSEHDPWDPDVFKSRLVGESQLGKQLGAFVAGGYLLAAVALIVAGYDPLVVALPILTIPALVICFGPRA